LVGVTGVAPTTDEPSVASPELNILALNSGSSSLKFGVYRVGHGAAKVLFSGETEVIGGQGDALGRICKQLSESETPAPDGVGHRIVHGGPHLRQHCLIDLSVLQQLEAACVFAPLHTPAALSIIRSAQAHFPGIPQVACFDTAFHAGLPEIARTLPIARELQMDGVERYGFHGLSCESIVRQVGGPTPERMIVAHLGAGASVTAVKAGGSVDTSMGLTPTGGVPMGTRSGDLDPGVLLYLLREKRFDAAMIEDLVDRRSGLLGVSGLSGDMRVLHEAAASNSAARLAVEMFCYAVAKQVAAMIAVLNGVDLLVFTGGIGENDAASRSAICGALSWIGVDLDEVRNRSAANPLSRQKSRCGVLVLASQEDEQIARHTWSLCGRASQ
jgi:acetate kinase